MTNSKLSSFKRIFGAGNDVDDESEGMITNSLEIGLIRQNHLDPTDIIRKSAESLERTTSTEASFNFDSNNDSSADDNFSNLSFLRYFLSSNGPPHIVFISFLLALAYGSTVGVVRNNYFNFAKF